MSHGKFRVFFEVSTKLTSIFLKMMFMFSVHICTFVFLEITEQAQDCTPDSRWVSEGRSKEYDRVLRQMIGHESLDL